MNVEKQLLKDGIKVIEKIDTDTVLRITNSISKKIANTFPNFNLNENEIFSKLFTLNMYKADMPEGMAEANYCYKNSSIYFNSHIPNEDLEEFAIHECLHFLQEVKDSHNKIIKMGLSSYLHLKTVGTGLNEAAVQYISSKIIGITPDFEKYYDINLYTPSPSYYPLECALLNEIVFFVGEDVLFKSTYFSNDDFKNTIISRTSKKVYETILHSFDDILNFEEKILLLNNNANENSNISKYRENIKSTFIETQNLIIKEFLNSEFNNITNLEELENYRRNLSKFKQIIGKTANYNFFDNYYLEAMNKLEHKSNILENGGCETAINNKSLSFFDLFKKIKMLLFSKNVHEK